MPDAIPTPAVPAAAAPAAVPAAAPAVGAPPAAPVTEPASPTAPPTPAEQPAGPTTFKSIFRSEMAKLSDEERGETPAPKTDGADAPAAAPATEGGEGGEGEGEDPDDDGGVDNGEGGAERESAPVPVKAAKYALVDGEGNALPVEWPEGVALELKPADGKARSVTNFGELAQLAVQGLELRAAVARKGNEVHKVREQLLTERTQLEEEHEDTIMAIVFDDDALEQLREKLAPYRDPGVRALAKQHRATQAADAARAAETQAAAADTTAQLYAVAEDRFSAFLPEYPLLDVEDALEVKRALHQRYLSLRESQGDEAAIRGAFNDTALRAAMDALHTRLQKRLGSHRPPPAAGERKPPAAPAAPAPDAAQQAAAHNAKVASELARKTASRTMSGAGAPPIGGPPAEKAPESYADGKALWRQKFRELADVPDA